MNDTPNGESAEVRKRMLALALKKSESKQVKWPTVSMPVTGFTRKKLVNY